MRAEVPNQGSDNWSRFIMKNKLIGTRLQFLKCYEPEDTSLWLDNNDDVNVKVKHEEFDVK